MKVDIDIDSLYPSEIITISIGGSYYKAVLAEFRTERAPMEHPTFTFTLQVLTDSVTPHGKEKVGYIKEQKSRVLFGE